MPLDARLQPKELRSLRIYPDDTEPGTESFGGEHQTRRRSAAEESPPGGRSVHHSTCPGRPERQLLTPETYSSIRDLCLGFVESHALRSLALRPIRQTEIANGPYRIERVMTAQ